MHCSRSSDRTADIITEDGLSVQVRAERSGDGDGRVYVITFEADDGNGGVTEDTVEVRVPHDQKGQDCDAVDSGQIFDATKAN